MELDKVQAVLLEAHGRLLRRDDVQETLRDLQAALAELQQDAPAVGAGRQVVERRSLPRGSWPNQEYRELIRHIRAIVRGALPRDARVIVVSKGDDELLRLHGRQAWHFPQDERGTYAGYCPVDSAGAIRHLEMLRASGGDFLLFPGTAFWWLDHYADFRRHLDSHYSLVWRDERCLIYRLVESAPGSAGRWGQDGREASDRRGDGVADPSRSGPADALRSLLFAFDQQLERLNALVVQSADLGAKALVDRPLEELGEGAAELLNYALGHCGFAAQGGLWVNHPILIHHHKAGVTLGWVNERIIELPYVIRAIADLPYGSHLLDFGAAESILSLSLASLGHDVVALDLRPYPFRHPRIRAVARPAEEWEGTERPFDAIISLSTLEHVGLGAYGGDRSPPDLDRQILGRFRHWLRPGGLLVLTAPYGRWAVDDFMRTYDAEHLDRLLDGWEICDRVYGVSNGPLRWDLVETEPAASTWATGARGVVMLRARLVA